MSALPAIDPVHASAAAAIARAAAATGIGFGYLYSQARIESGLDPAAQATTSSARGLYQFVEQSWLATVAQHGGEHGLGWAAAQIERGSDGRYRIADAAARAAVLDLRNDAQASASMAAASAADNRDYLSARLGREAEPVDLYLAHFLGRGGAGKFLSSDQQATGAALFPAAARANRNVFYASDGTARSLGEIRARFAARFDTGNTAPPPLRYAAAEVPAAAALPAGRARLAYLMLASLGVSA